MTTLETNVTIAPDGRLTGQAPTETPPGQYRTLLEPLAPRPSRSESPIELKVFSWPGWPADSRFRREDIYEDDGR
jgi:hypothetical protein